MRPQLNLEQIEALLAASAMVASWHVLMADEAAGRALYKIRCQLLRPAYRLEIRLIHTEAELLYSYQLFTDKPILRWDNAPHFPALSNFPHHFHAGTSEVRALVLTGDPVQDLPYVLAHVQAFLSNSAVSSPET